MFFLFYRLYCLWQDDLVLMTCMIRFWSTFFNGYPLHCALATAFEMGFCLYFDDAGLPTEFFVGSQFPIETDDTPEAFKSQYENLSDYEVSTCKSRVHNATRQVRASPALQRNQSEESESVFALRKLQQREVLFKVSGHWVSSVCVPPNPRGHVFKVPPLSAKSGKNKSNRPYYLGFWASKCLDIANKVNLVGEDNKVTFSCRVCVCMLCSFVCVN